MYVCMCICALYTRVRCFSTPAKNKCLPPGGAVASIENVCFNTLGLESKVDEQVRENPGDGEEDKFTPACRYPECGPWPSSIGIAWRRLVMQNPIPPQTFKQASRFYHHGGRLDARPQNRRLGPKEKG